MANMNVPYARPDRALLTLRDEVYAAYGYTPARASEFVTGYKSPSNLTGHNADANGVVHAVDIFTDENGNLPEAQGRELAEKLRQIGAATNRFSYLIHDMSPGAPWPAIAGQFNGWVWQTYNGSSPHSDHIHVSVCDMYWGDPAPVPASVYDSTEPWGIAGVTAASGTTVTPIVPEEDTLSAAEVAELKAHIDHRITYIASDGMQGRNERGPLADTAERVNAILDTLTPGKDKVRFAGPVFGALAAIQGQNAGILEALKQVASKPGSPVDLDAVKAAAAQGVAEALDGARVTVQAKEA